ncbi:hypothetical protein M8818_005398 [Zalaria obscura]|uniref:Uncharacterized protein n=1 Tax=Zalaria obscura TaxID=2024903 RepID=A0ACC3S899_9PEZI
MPVSAGRTASNPRQAGYKASEQGSSWGLEEINGGITQTRTVTVTGHRASEDTDIAMLREEIAGRRSLQKGRRAHSPSGSMDPIMGGRHLGLPGATGKSGTMATVSVEPVFDDDLKSEGSDDSVALPGRVQRAHSNARIL